MTHTIRIPAVEQYAFYEFQLDGTPEEVMAEYNRLTDLVHGGKGVGMKKLAEILIEYVKTGEISMGGEYEFSLNESLLLNEAKKIIRKDKNN